MPNWKELYGQNNYLNVERIGSKTIVGVIEACDVVQSTFKGKETTRLCISLDSLDAKISLNHESAKALGDAFGDDSDEWIGKKVMAKKGTVKFGKGTVPAIVVTPTGVQRKK